MKKLYRQLKRATRRVSSLAALALCLTLGTQSVAASSTPLLPKGDSEQKEPWETATYKTIDVTTPGTLESLMWELDADDHAVAIKGTLDINDIKYLASTSNSIVSNIKYLDISGITVDAEGEYYNSSSGKSFEFSHDNNVTTHSTDIGGGPVSIVGNPYNVYHNDGLGGLFDKHTNLEYVKLPGWLTNIGPYTFNECSKLKKVDFGNKIETIWLYAFSSTDLSAFELPSSVKTIGAYAFSGTPLKTINLQNVDSIGSRAFYYSKLTSVDLSNVRQLGTGCFKDCRELGRAVFAKGLTEIPGQLFESCGSLTDVVLPENITYIGSGAFSGTKWLNAQGSEGGVIYIGNIAYSLKYGEDIGSKLTIREGTTGISPDFISSCRFSSARVDIVFPNTLKRIEESAFSSTSNGAITKVTLGNGLEYIGAKAFSGCSNMGIKELPASLTYIGDDAFSGCANMGIKALPSGLTYIGERAFSGCSNMSFSVLPEHLKYIGVKAFSGCNATSIKSITLGEDIEYIGAWAFDSMTNLEKVILNSRQLKYAQPFSVDKVKVLEVGEKVEIIPRLFRPGYTSLSEVIFRPRTTEVGLRIEEYALERRDVKTVVRNFPSDVTYIGKYALQNMDFADPVRLPRVEYIGEYAFSYATGLTEITLPYELREIGDGAFWGCEALITVRVDSKAIESAGKSFSNSGLKEAIIGSGVERLPSDLFRGCRNLEKFTFDSRDESAYKELVIEPECFAYKSWDYTENITEFKFPIGTVSVGVDVFNGAPERMEFPTTFRQFEGMRYDNTMLIRKASKIDVTCRAVVPPAGFEHLQCSGGTDFPNITVYVPEESVDAYKADTNGWGRCNIVAMGSGIEELQAEAEADDVTAIHTLQGVRLQGCVPDELAPGVYIVTYKSGRTVKLIK